MENGFFWDMAAGNLGMAVWELRVFAFELKIEINETLKRTEDDNERSIKVWSNFGGTIRVLTSKILWLSIFSSPSITMQYINSTIKLWNWIIITIYDSINYSLSNRSTINVDFRVKVWADNIER